MKVCRRADRPPTHTLRPPLSKKVFPVGLVGTICASREVGISPPPLISLLYKLEYTGQKIIIRREKNTTKKNLLAAFRPSRVVHRKQLFI